MTHIQQTRIIEFKQTVKAITTGELIKLLQQCNPKDKPYFPYGSFTLVDIQGVFIENDNTIIIMPTYDRFNHDPMKFSWKGQGNLLK